VRDNTRKLYMAATRAGQRLVIIWVLLKISLAKVFG
jgi:hypothetical protein